MATQPARTRTPASSQRVRPRQRAPRRTTPSSRPAQARREHVLLRFGAPVGFALAVVILTLGWLGRSTRDLSAEEGLGYALGIVAVGCMLTLLLYPLRKRLRFLKFLGPARNWFRVHMSCGICVPVAALYHCNFQLGSLNSQLALYSALLVAASGLVGRFLYMRVHRNLNGKKTDLKRLRQALGRDRPAGPRSLGFLKLVKQRMDVFDRRVLDNGASLWRSLFSHGRLRRRALREIDVLTSFGVEQLAREAARSQIIAAHQDRLATLLYGYLAGHMRKVHRVSQLQVYERLFALWHVVHLPFFLLLILTVIVHVLAVHLY